MKPKETIEEFDLFLFECGMSFEAIVIGGTALALLGITSRQTRDCDVLYPDLPSEILAAARDFATRRRAAADPLAENWLNNGPSSLADSLPGDWLSRVQPAFEGRAVTLRVLGRGDLLRSKLFALCDRGIDLPDCLALAPSAAEIDEIRPWLEQQDANPGWPEYVRATLDDLRARIADGL